MSTDVMGALIRPEQPGKKLKEVVDLEIGARGFSTQKRSSMLEEEELQAALDKLMGKVPKKKNEGPLEDAGDAAQGDSDEDDAEVVTLDSDTEDGNDSPPPVCTISDVFSGPSFVQYPDWDSAPGNPPSETGEHDTEDRDLTSDEDDDIQIVEEITSSLKRERTLQEILGELSK